MAKLVLSLQGRVLSEFPVDKEHITIGRKPDNDIHIDNLAVSSHHAVLHTLFNQVFLEDLESTNGTFINGERITKRAIKDGDAMLIGKHELKYVGDQSAGAAAEEEDDPFGRTVLIRSPFDTAIKPAPAPPPPPAPAVDQAHGHRAKLAILSGKDSGKEFTITKEVTTFGVKGLQVAAISEKPDGYYISHVEGAASCTVNGEFIGSRSVHLKEYDVLEVAGTKMTFLIA